MTGGPDPRERDFVRAVARQAKRAGRSGMDPWRGLAAVGTIGWLVVLPTVAGALVGRALDARLGTGVFWTLSLLGTGLVAGCVAAWRYAWAQLAENDDRRSGGSGSSGPGGRDDRRSGGAP